MTTSLGTHTGCGLFFHGDIQNLTGHTPGKLDLTLKLLLTSKSKVGPTWTGALDQITSRGPFQHKLLYNAMVFGKEAILICLFTLKD